MSFEPSKPAPTAAPRIISMDQFRGYTVAGMFLVNFVGGLTAFPEVLKHHNGHPYFSYADTIMPSFMFAAGFSYRLSALKRFAKVGTSAAYRHFIVRSLALVLVSLVMYAAEDLEVKKWSQLTPHGTYELVAMLFKANLWEVLAIIGVVQIFILPVIAAGTRVRHIAWIVCAVVHLVISWWFNFFFVYGKPNFLDELLGLTGKGAWDGGFFGVIGWAIPMLLGTIAFDIMANRRPRRPRGRCWRGGSDSCCWGMRFDCLTTLYDTDKGTVAVLGGRRGRLAGDPAVFEPRGPVTRIAPGDASVRAAAADHDPSAQLLDDEQEGREPAVFALLVGVCLASFTRFS